MSFMRLDAWVPNIQGRFKKNGRYDGHREKDYGSRYKGVGNIATKKK